jgi:hypothetical protein
VSWRLAGCLVVLRDEFDRLAPNRSKRSDGTIGDPAHAARASRHNKNRYGVVTALDITHDPANGCDVHAIARRIVLDPHDELDYVISDGQIASRPDFRWWPYDGSNPHTSHAHFGVGQGPDRDPRPPYDSTAPWGVSNVEDDDMLRRGQQGPDVGWLQNRLNVVIHGDPAKGLRIDGDYGPVTASAVAEAKRLLRWGDDNGDHCSGWFGNRLAARIAWNDDDRKRQEHVDQYHKVS